MVNMAAFYETRTTLRNFVEFEEPLTFDAWKVIPDDKKAAALFLHFFEQITLAWDKANAFDFVDGEEGVTTVLQYLQKQVCDIYEKGHPKKKATRKQLQENPEKYAVRRVLEETPEKFSEAYIYRVAYNALYCICHDLKSVQDRWDNETSSIVEHDGEELNLFDTISNSRGSSADMSEADQMEKEFWSIIESEGPCAEKVMRYLLANNNETELKKVPKSRKSHPENDPLKNIEVPLDAVDEILNKLQEKFMDLSISSPCGSFISKFEVLHAC